MRGGVKWGEGKEEERRLEEAVESGERRLFSSKLTTLTELLSFVIINNFYLCLK